MPDRGNTGKIVTYVVGALLAAGIAFGVWWFWLPGGPGQAQQAALPEPPAAKAAPTSNAATLVTPPGKEREGGGTFRLSRLRHNQLLPKQVVDALGDAKITEGLLRTTTTDGTTIGLYALDVDDETSASRVAKVYDGVQESGGVPPYDSLSMNGVPVFANAPQSQQSIMRSAYVVHDRVVILEVFATDRDAVMSTFTSLLHKQVDHAPPTVRGR